MLPHARLARPGSTGHRIPPIMVWERRRATGAPEASSRRRLLKIIVAKHMGFCGGVRRAVDIAEKTAASAGGPVQTWGPLIHNPQVVHGLEQAGVLVAEHREELTGE